MLTATRINLLNNIGFDWGVRYGDAIWEKHFAKLIMFQSIEGHCNVPTKDHEDTALGRWVSEQRRLFKLNRLEEDRRDRLEKKGFVFECY